MQQQQTDIFSPAASYIFFTEISKRDVAHIQRTTLNNFVRSLFCVCFSGIHMKGAHSMVTVIKVEHTGEVGQTIFVY